jgi:GTP cyclohydrolase II
MRLMTNVQRTIAGIDGYGLSVVERVPLPHGRTDGDG